MDAIRSVQDLDVYRLSFEAAMDVFQITKGFPREERYSLTDQIRRSSRSVAGNLREGFTKRRYRNVFARHITDSWGSAEETRTWLEFASACRYIDQETCDRIDEKYDRISAMLFKLQQKWT